MKNLTSRTLLVVLALAGLGLSNAAAQNRNSQPRCCPPKYQAPRLGPDGKPVPTDATESEPGTQEAMDQATAAPQSPAPSTLASSSQPAAPNMLGDFLYSRAYLSATDFVIVPSTVTADIPSPSARRFKISENDSILPQDRVFFTYNYFDEAFTVDTRNFIIDPEARKFDYNSYVVGFEKSLFSGNASVAVRLPINSSVEYDSFNFDINNDGGIGNVPITLKAVLASNCNYALGAGLTISTPTGDDVYGRVNDIHYKIQNDSVHLLPYVGLAYTPRCSPLFINAALQFDFDTNGNGVSANSPFHVHPEESTWDEETLLYLSASIGYWLHRNPCNNNGLAALVEFHYTSSIEDTDPATASNLGTQISFGNVHDTDIVNCTFGGHLQLGTRNLRFGAVVPLNDEEEQLFAFELMCQFNQYF